MLQTWASWTIKGIVESRKMRSLVACVSRVYTSGVLIHEKEELRSIRLKWLCGGLRPLDSPNLQY